jgi:hypothetical protein
MVGTLNKEHTMIKLSKTSKLDGIMSWSLMAVETCPGAIGTDGQLVDACKGCYATTGNYRFSNVKAPREFNRTDWQRMDWVFDMVAGLAKQTHFRWFDSGDMYSLDLAEKIYQVMQATPHVKHWMPTRMHKFAKYADVLARMQALPNVVVRYSSDSVSGGTVSGLTTSTIVGDESQLPAGAVLCEAYKHDGKCNGCRACYSKDVPIVAYKAHGQKMAKVIKINKV